MEIANLPLEKAQEPNEEAKQPTCDKTMAFKEKHILKKQNVAFTGNMETNEYNNSQNSSSYKEALSQPAPGLTHRQRLQWLQKRRTTGLWAQCDDCDRWRWLPHVIDSHELPKKWYCRFNPDKTLANCSAPEVPIHLRDEEDLIYNEYSAGSIVWARLPGWPWWPAMVNDCPDNEQFFWLDGFSDIPTHYNVVFFDTSDVTRAWIAPKDIKPFSTNKKTFKHLVKNRRYKIRIGAAVRQADDANMLPLIDRLEKYSFVARYKGTIYQPKQINKKTLNKFKKQLKRKFKIDFSDGSSGETDNDDECEIANKPNKNIIILGTPKKVPRKIRPKVLSDSYSNSIEDTGDGQIDKNDENIVIATNELRATMEPDSTSVQIGSSGRQDTIKESSKGDCDENEINSVVKDFKTRTVTPNSDDFDF